MRNIPLLLRAQRGPIAACFLDVTDVWFEGLGPEFAERARTKEGLRNRQKVGIVLLCYPDGFPLRWSVLRGKAPEAEGMRAHINALKAVSWVGEAPVICDRAMGQLTEVSHLLMSGLRFLTAIPRSQIETHMDQSPVQPFFDFKRTVKEDPSDERTADKVQAAKDFAADAARLRDMALEQKFTRYDDLLYVLDLGVAQRPLGQCELPWVDAHDVDPEKLTEPGAASRNSSSSSAADCTPRGAR